MYSHTSTTSLRCFVAAATSLSFLLLGSLIWIYAQKMRSLESIIFELLLWFLPQNFRPQKERIQQNASNSQSKYSEDFMNGAFLKDNTVVLSLSLSLSL